MSLGTAAPPNLAESHPEFRSLATRSENVLIGAGLADQPQIGGACSALTCEFTSECGPGCYCLPLSWPWGFCVRG